jgi:hypothetical protein
MRAEPWMRAWSLSLKSHSRGLMTSHSQGCQFSKLLRQRAAHSIVSAITVTLKHALGKVWPTVRIYWNGHYSLSSGGIAWLVHARGYDEIENYMKTSLESFYGLLRDFVPVRSFVSYDHTFIPVYMPFHSLSLSIIV